MDEDQNRINDDLENPLPHNGVTKAAAEKVLSAAIKAGSSALSIVTGLLAAILILYSGYVLFDSFSTLHGAESDSWDLLEYKPEILEDNLVPTAGGDTLRRINDDYRAWLTIYETTIDYPVLQGTDDLYYASHDIYGNSSLTGAIYLAAANQSYLLDSYNLVYGHHMDNKAMFGALDDFLEEGYFNAHREGLIVGRSGIYDIELFAVVRADAYNDMIYTVGDRAREVIDYLASGGDGSETGHVIYFDADVAETAEKVIALSTCASAETNGRLILFGKMILKDILLIDAEDVEVIYDGETHTIEAVASLPGAVITYSIDGGETWTEEPPTLTDVGEYSIMVHAEHGSAVPVETTALLKVNPRPVTVTAENVFKTYGSEDPEWTVAIDGLLDGDTVIYAVEREPGEDVGTYPIIPSGEEAQGNYTVTYRPGTLTITSAGILAVTATGYTGVYDGQPHYGGASVNITEGTAIEYSTDGGETWSEDPPVIIYPGTIPFIVRAVNPNYETAYAVAELIVTDAPVPEETVTLTIVNIWNDQNNADGVRPNQLYLVLTGGGQSRIVEVGPGNSWAQTITLLRYDENGNEITYTWTVPAVNGYETTMSTEGTVTTVIHTRQTPPVVPGTYTLRISYRYLDGTQVLDDYVATLTEGAAYDVTSPVIVGFTASILRVTGVMPGQNVEYVVFFVPNAMVDPAQPAVEAQEGDMTVLIEDYATPLGLGSVFINIGDCFE